jgi:hypothetical protein
MLSAGQIPCLFQEWLNSFMIDQKAILKIGKTIHEHLITSYQKIWKYRCSNNSALSMDFGSQLATFPRGVPVHELNEDDCANNVKLSSTSGVERTRSKKRKQALRYQVKFHHQTRPPWLRRIISTINQKERVQHQLPKQTTKPTSS